MDIKNIILSFIIGDSLGLSKLNNYEDNNIVIKDNKTLNIEKGNYSFYTTNLLATIDSITKYKNIVPKDILNKLCMSLITGKYTSDKVYDLDKVSLDILEHYSKKNNINYKYNELDYSARSLSRIIPIVIYNYYNEDTLDTIISIISITNINEEVLIGAFIYYKYILNILEGYDKYKSLKIDIPNYFSLKNKIKYKHILKYNIYYSEIKYDENIYNVLKIIFYIILNSNNMKDVLMMLCNLEGNINLYCSLTLPIATILYGNDELNNLYKVIKNKRTINKYIKDYERIFR